MWAQTPVPYVLWHDIFLKLTVFYSLRIPYAYTMDFDHINLPTPPLSALPVCLPICASPTSCSPLLFFFFNISQEAHLVLPICT